MTAGFRSTTENKRESVKMCLAGHVVDQLQAKEFSSMDSTYSGRLLVCNDRYGVAFCNQEKLNVVYKDDAVRCVPFSKFRGTKTVEIGETDPTSYPSTVNRARLVAKFPHIAPKEIKGQEFAKLLATPCQASSIPFDKPEHNGTAWEVGLVDVDGPSLKCVQYNSLLVTVSNKKVHSIPLARAQGAALKRIELESQDRQLYSPDDVSERVENALEGKGALFVDDADFVESMCVNPKANGTMIVVEFPIRMTRYGVVVKNEDGSFDVIYRRRIPYSYPIRISYSDFVVNARKVKLWKPPREKIDKLGCEYKIYPRAEVAERARSAVKHGAVKDSAIGNLEEGFPPEKFLLQMCVHTDDWRLLECKVNLNKVLVRLYQPAKELKAGDVVCSESQNFGVVHSITNEGDVLLGHFGPEPGDEKSVLLDPLGEKWKGCVSGNPQLTSLEEFSSREKPSFVYRVEYMKCDAVWDVETIQKRIVLAVEGNLLPDGKPLLAHPLPEGFNSRIAQIEPGQNRLVPAYHQMNWNSEDWAFWIVRGQSGES